MPFSESKKIISYCFTTYLAFLWQGIFQQAILVLPSFIHLMNCLLSCSLKSILFNITVFSSVAELMRVRFHYTGLRRTTLHLLVNRLCKNCHCTVFDLVAKLIANLNFFKFETIKVYKT